MLIDWLIIDFEIEHNLYCIHAYKLAATPLYA